MINPVFEDVHARTVARGGHEQKVLMTLGFADRGRVVELQLKAAVQGRYLGYQAPRRQIRDRLLVACSGASRGG